MKNNVIVVFCTIAILAVFSSCFGNDKKETETKKNNGVFLIQGSKSIEPLTKLLSEEFAKKNPKPKIKVQGTDSSNAVKTVSDGTTTIGLVSRNLTDSEKEIVKEKKIAIDIVAVVVNLNNKVKNLSKKQLKDIYSGKITNWKEVGGEDSVINVINHEAKSEERIVIEDYLFLDDKSYKFADKIKLGIDPSKVRDNVVKDKSSISYLTYSLADATVKMLAIDGIDPTVKDILSGAYKVVRPFILVTKEEPEGDIKKFIDFIGTNEAKNLILRKYLVVK